MHDVSPRVAAVRLGVVAFAGDAHDAASFAERAGARVGGAGTVEEAHLLAYLAEPGRAVVAAAGEDPWTRLDPAPVYLLGGAGLSSAQRERLAWLGVDTVGALRGWTPAQLLAFLGDEGRALTPVLHGPRIDHVPVRPPPVVVAAEHAFDDAACEPAEIDPILERLVERAAEALGERSAERVRVLVSTAGLRSDATRRAKAPLRDPVRLLRLARLALSDTGLVPLGLDELRIELSGLTRRAEAGELWAQRRRRAEAARAVHARFPGQARRFALHDPDALRPRLRWQLLDLASGDPLPWDGPAPRDGTIVPPAHDRSAATRAPGTGGRTRRRAGGRRHRTPLLRIRNNGPRMNTSPPPPLRNPVQDARSPTTCASKAICCAYATPNGNADENPPATTIRRAALHNGLPARVELGDGRVRDVVRVHDAWRVGNRWWRGETPSRHYLLELDDGLTLEVYEQAGAWRLERVLD